MRLDEDLNFASAVVTLLLVTPKIPVGLYHSSWFIVIFHRIALHFHFLSCLVLFCYTVHYCFFSFFIFSLQSINQSFICIRPLGSIEVMSTFWLQAQ